VPEEPGKRFPAVVRTADVLLAATREAETEEDQDGALIMSEAAVGE
jgi:hypothetical protein